MKLRSAAWLISGLFMAACGGSPASPSVATKEQGLSPIGNCQQLERRIKDKVRADMQERVLSNWKLALQGGGPCYGPWADGAKGVPMPAAVAAANGGAESAEGAKEYSTTTTQEAGVDEADFVKNDNRNIYLLAGNQLQIYQAWPAPQTRLIASVGLEGRPRALFVSSGKAVVYSDVESKDATLRIAPPWYYRYRAGLKITVLDLTDLERARVEREISLDGSYESSRRIDSAVHTVVTFPEFSFPELRDWPDDLPYCGEKSDPMAVYVAFRKLLAKNLAIIAKTPMASLIPSIQDTRILPDGRRVEQDLLAGCQGIYWPSDASGQGFASVLSLDLVGGATPKVTTIVGQQGEIYASSGALYLTHQNWNTKPHYGIWHPTWDEGRESTTFHKFSLQSSPASSTYQASGVVEGRLLNQFSMSERDGFLRVATTTGYLPDPEAHNSIFVLGQEGKDLSVVGSITGIAPGEDIRSARFMGDRGFIVTFKKTDPLFAIDLADPRNPHIEGELKIPGFSTYIHRMDEQHLLTIGFDAEDQGDFAWFQGLELQIFDISDMQNPTLEHKTLLGTRGSSSEATANHLAFNYFPQKNLLALPMAICEGSAGGGSYGTQMTFSGLIVWNVTAEAGFAERGRVSFPVEGGSASACSSWWQNPQSHVKRSIIMDDYVFSIADGAMKVNHLDRLAEDLAVFELPVSPDPSPYIY